MDLQFLFSHAIAKGTKFFIKNISKGGATAAPGFFSLYLDHNILKKLASNLETTILVTGTNGKTTTTRLIGDFLENLGVEFVHNRHGSNLERGLISAFLENTNLSGQSLVKTALFEVDEAAIANVLPKLNPQVLVITNLFRDQLDRYGEVNNIRRIWEKCLKNLPEQTTLILNADDPSLASLGKNASCRVIYFGLSDKNVSLEKVPDTVDNINCPSCRSELKYTRYYISHQGEYSCPVCHFTRAKLDIWAEEIESGSSGSEFVLHYSDKIRVDIKTRLAGLFNVYNILASFGALSALDFNLDTFPLVVKNFKPAFGRAENLEFEGRKVIVTLAKNPTGFNEVIRTFFSRGQQIVLIAINDLIADGRDVSWLWDVDFESVRDFGTKFFISGLRASDMALRLKYAGIKNYQVNESLSEALEAALEALPQKDTLLIVPTYTAMLELKKVFAKKGAGGQFWED
ncbi:MAG TPA: MurT ligase domain-containing protein [Candidatus Nanoarchaeia archaeon]|nr:UDP-N-acetylmuramoyl-L-alanyl-D-glutamate--2,6-diaminopimelate ligase [uncultured archaeon]